MKTLQEQYNQIKNGKGSKEIFLKEAKSKYPYLVRNAAGFEEASSALIGRNIISEGIYVTTGTNEKPDWFKLFDKNMNLIAEEDVKAVSNKVSKEVTDLQAPEKGYDYKSDKMLDNVSGEQFRQGYYTELTDEANADKTKQELINLVIKNLDSNPLYYVEDAQFGIKGIGYTEDAPALGKGKQVKDPGVGGGYGEATTKDFPDGEVGTGYLELNESTSIKLVNLLESTPLGEKPKRRKVRAQAKKETPDSKLAEIEKNAKIATLEMQIEALEEIIESKNERISMVTEDDNLAELIDKAKMKEMQKEIKLLEKKKANIEKIYEKMCGKAYKKVVTELNPENIKEEETISESKFQAGDMVRLKNDGGVGPKFAVISTRKMFASKLHAVRVTDENGKTSEYDETQLELAD